MDNYEYYEDEELPVRKVGGCRIGVTGDGGGKLAATDVHMESGMENNGSDEGDGERDDTKLIDDFTTDQNTDKEDRGMNNDGDDNSGAKDDERSEEVAVDAVVMNNDTTDKSDAGLEKGKTMGKQISATKVNTRNKGKRNIKK